MQYRKRPVLKNDALIERYPRLFSVCFITVCFGMLFSRPIYDFYTSFQLFMRDRELTKQHMSRRDNIEKEEE